MCRKIDLVLVGSGGLVSTVGVGWGEVGGTGVVILVGSDGRDCGREGEEGGGIFFDL